MKLYLRMVKGTYGDSYITEDGIKAFVGADGSWYARFLDDTYPCAAWFENAEEAICAARKIKTDSTNEKQEKETSALRRNPLS